MSIEENFFDLGGHSLLLVQMHDQLCEALHTEFPIVKLFEHPTVRSLARHLDRPSAATQETNEAWNTRAQQQKRALEKLRSKMGKG